MEIKDTNCPICGKKFAGTTDNQVKIYLNYHMLARHPEKVKVVMKEGDE